MKKILFMVTIGVAGLMSAKTSDNISKPNILKFEKNTKVFGEVKWHYLYQSTCGWTFIVTSDIGIQNMTDAQYRDFMADVAYQNERTCKLHGEKPNYNYAFNEKNTIAIKKEKV